MYIICFSGRPLAVPSGDQQFVDAHEGRGAGYRDELAEQLPHRRNHPARHRIPGLALLSHLDVLQRLVRSGAPFFRLAHVHVSLINWLCSWCGCCIQKRPIGTYFGNKRPFIL